MTTMRFGILMLALALALSAGTAVAQSATGGRLDTIERRLNAIDPQSAGMTVAQADDSQRLDAIERRLDALEKRLGSSQQAQPLQQPPSPTTAAVQLPGGAIQQVPKAALPAPGATAVHLSYRDLGLHKGMTEAEVIQLLGPPVRTVRGFVDVLFYSKNLEPNVNIQYGHVVDWND
jgi:hypothetical protein